MRLRVSLIRCHTANGLKDKRTEKRTRTLREIVRHAYQLALPLHCRVGSRSQGVDRIERRKVISFILNNEYYAFDTTPPDLIMLKKSSLLTAPVKPSVQC